MKNQPRLHVSYLLRMWQAEEAGKLVWRSSLEDPQTGKMLFFASLPLLFEFLEKGGYTQFKKERDMQVEKDSGTHSTQDVCSSPSKAEKDNDSGNS